MPNAGIGTPYWYEWEIGLIECLKMMTNPGVQSVVLQSSDFECLDDVVVNYIDGSMVNIQVKHTDIDDTFSYSFLSEDSLLSSLFKEWNTTRIHHNIVEVRLATNRRWGNRKSHGKCSFVDFVNNVYPKLKLDFHYTSAIDEENNAIKWFKDELGANSDQEIEDFIHAFSFQNNPDLAGLELTINDLIHTIIGIDRDEAISLCRTHLYAALETWATSKRLTQEIKREDIYSLFCIGNYQLPPRYELYPEKPVFPSRISFADKFIEQVTNSQKHMFFLQGLPGSGKTNFVSYLSQMDDSIVDFRYYAYLPVNKQYPSYSDDEGFYTGDLLWTSLLSQMKSKFEQLNILHEVGFPLVYGFLSCSEKREKALKLLPVYAQSIGRTCYIFIDGLDHAARSTIERNSFLHQLPQPQELGNGIKIILVGQPINDKYPHWLSNNSDIEYIQLAELCPEDVSALLESENINISPIDPYTFANSIVSTVGNNALNVIFAVYEIKRMPSTNLFDDIINTLTERQLNGQIERYYEWIISSLTHEPLLFRLEAIFAYSSRKITIEELSLLCRSSISDLKWYLDKLFPLLQEDGDSYYVTHNDIRLFLHNKTRSNGAFFALVDELTTIVLQEKNLSVFRYDLLFGMVFESKALEKLLAIMTPEYILDSVLFDISANILWNHYLKILSLVNISTDFALIEKIGNLSTVLSQYINCINYYQLERQFIDEKKPDALTRSEKYVLDAKTNIQEIIADIYQLLISNQKVRAQQVYHEYFYGYNLNSFLQVDSGDNWKFYKQCGYVCRFFSRTILDTEAVTSDEAYSHFVSGWISASTQLLTMEELIYTFSFKSYYPDDIVSFTNKICTNNDICSDVLACLAERFTNSQVPITARISLCAYLLLHGHDTDNLSRTIVNDQGQLASVDHFDYRNNIFLYSIKMLFCIYRIDSGEVWETLYNQGLQTKRITATSRGFDAAIAQKSLAQKVFSLFFSRDKKAYSNEILYDVALFSRRYGPGPCLDCGANEVKQFIMDVLTQYILHAADDTILNKAAIGVANILTADEKPLFDKHLLPILYAKRDVDEIKRISTFWCGEHGKVWSESYDRVENICDNVERLLIAFGETDLASQIAETRKRRIISYIDHKDYSLLEIYDLFVQLPLSTDKLLIDGLSLLEISDIASRIGDNEVNLEIDRALFQTAVTLGPKYANALFELKNTPSDFMHWRDCLLSEYYHQLSINQFSDDQLLSLYRLTNAWIKPTLETQHTEDRKLKLQRWNKAIYDSISIQNKTVIQIDSLPLSDSVADVEREYHEKNEENIRILLNELKKGYNDAFECFFNSFVERPQVVGYDLSIRVKDFIPKTFRYSFTKNCIVPYVCNQTKYSLRFTSLSSVIEEYSPYFTKESWYAIIHSIIVRISARTTPDDYMTGTDFNTLSRIYYMLNNPEQITTFFREKCRIQHLIISACGQLQETQYELRIDDSIHTLSDLVDRQIGKEEQQ